MSISRIVQSAQPPLDLAGVFVNKLLLKVNGLGVEVFQVQFPLHRDLEGNFLALNPNLKKISRLFINPIEEISVGYYMFDEVTHAHVLEVNELEEEEECSFAKAHFLTFEDERAYLNLVPLKTLKSSKRAQVTLHEKWFETKLQRVVLKASAHIASEKRDVDEFYAILRDKLGEDNLKIVRGIQKRHLRFIGDLDEKGGEVRKLISDAYSGNLFTDGFKIDIPKRVEYAHQLIEGLFWMRYLNMIYLDIKLENCLYNKEEAVLADLDGIRPFTEDEDFEKRIPYTPRYLDNFSAGALLKPLLNNGQFKEAFGLIGPMQVFSLGVALYILFVRSLPFALKADPEAPEDPPIINKEDLVNKFGQFEQKLTQANCPQYLARFIVWCLYPDYRTRPSLQHHKEFIIRYNPLISFIKQ